MGAGASSADKKLSEKESSVMKRYHEYHSKSFGDEREEWEKHLPVEKAKLNGTKPGPLTTESPGRIDSPTEDCSGADVIVADAVIAADDAPP